MIRYFYSLAVLLIIVSSCAPKQDYHKLRGETMGTYYMVSYHGSHPQKVSEDIEQLLIDFNNSLSTYIPSSLISQLNASDRGVVLPDSDPYFEPVWDRARELYVMTDGKVNTAIMPMLRYWRDNGTEIDTAISLAWKDLVRQSTFTIEDRNGGRWIAKSPEASELDFSSLAKGYGIDVIAAYLSEVGVADYLVDIGGEARASGVNNIGQPWTLAINKPIEGGALTDVELIIQLSDRSIATSGTYRQFYEKDGKKIAHIMDPISGYGTSSNLLSASVIADDCMTADGLATALMVCTLEEAQAFLSAHDYPACLIYDGDGVDPLEKYYANGFDEIVVRSE